ncbi:MAG: TonB-dependent receptor [Opitutaceae bacterium]
MHPTSFSFPFARPLGLVLAGGAAFAIPVDAQVSTPARETVELDEFVITALPFARSAEELHQAAALLGGDRLDDIRSGTLGETLDGQPGVSSTSFGPGAGRPIIRGLDGERIRVLTNGVGTIDASGASPDHAVSLDPALVERVEIVRGPAALLYGSSAAGGVVNVVENRIPIERASEGISGAIDAHIDTVANERAGSGSFRGASDRFGWQASFSKRKSGDVDIPGCAETEPHADEAPGTLENSAVATTAGSAGLAWFWSRGRAGLAFSGFDTRYGVPGHEHHHEEDEDLDAFEIEILADPAADPFEIAAEEGEEEEHGGVLIDLEQRRVDLAADVTEPFAFLENVRFRAGYADYRHLELEGDEIATQFDTEGWEARVDAVHRPIGRVEGALGFQLQRHKLSVAGEEAFLPPTLTTSHALFGIEEVVTGSVRWQAGARVEDQEVSVLNDSPDGRSKTAWSTSAGALWTIDPRWTLALSLARTERNPTAQEWFANGPHAATRAFEIGNPGLGKEKSSGIDLSLRRRTGRVTGAVSLFHTDYDRFIFGKATGATEDGFDVYRFVATDARFYGGEIEATWHLHESDAHDFELTVMGDVVHATNQSDNTGLPRIPPVRAGIALDYHGRSWTAGVDVRRSFSQDRVAPLESPTSGYTLVGAHLGYTLQLERQAVSFYLRGTNLTDEEARPHPSFLKDIAPLPGRNLIAGARLEF